MRTDRYTKRERSQLFLNKVHARKNRVLAYILGKILSGKKKMKKKKSNAMRATIRSSSKQKNETIFDNDQSTLSW